MSDSKNMVDLKILGYDQFFEGDKRQLDEGIDFIARVTAEHRGVYEVVGVAGVDRATVTGKRMLDATSRDDFPAVGDWVVIESGRNDMRLITDILPRKTTLHKKRGGNGELQLIGTNIDVALIVESVDRDQSLNRIERYIMLARQGGVLPVIVLNKADLYALGDLAQRADTIRKRFGDIDVLATSTVSEDGVKELRDYIKPRLTYCFIGSSGAGKSSLINRLLRQDSIATTEISKKTGRGMHTTTARQMYVMNTGGIIIDNPGSREVGVGGASLGLAESFADIEDLASGCRFSNCSHANENECAVLRALHRGILGRDRYDNYLKIKNESKIHALKAYKKRQKSERKTRKSLTKNNITYDD